MPTAPVPGPRLTSSQQVQAAKPEPKKPLEKPIAPDTAKTERAQQRIAGAQKGGNLFEQIKQGAPLRKPSGEKAPSINFNQSPKQVAKEINGLTRVQINDLSAEIVARIAEIATRDEEFREALNINAREWLKARAKALLDQHIGKIGELAAFRQANFGAVEEW